MESCRSLRIGAWKAYFYKDPALRRAWSGRADGGGAFAPTGYGYDGGESDCTAGSAFRIYKRDLLRKLI